MVRAASGSWTSPSLFHPTNEWVGERRESLMKPCRVVYFEGARSPLPSFLSISVCIIVASVLYFE